MARSLSTAVLFGILASAASLNALATDNGQREIVLHLFRGGSDGYQPSSPLALSHDGSFYGTTYSGGECGAGTIYKLNGTEEKIVLSFCIRGNPFGSLVLDDADNIFGATTQGTIYKASPDGTETILHTFSHEEGDYPWTGLIADRSGNLFGATSSTGISGGGIFRLSSDGTYTTLHTFQSQEGYNPQGALTMDDAGNIYGTNSRGGLGDFDGTVFKLASDGTFSLLYSFTGRKDGAQPEGRLAIDGGGNLYGTTYDGGEKRNGVVFEINAAGDQLVLYSFKGGLDGANPDGGVLVGPDGLLYGTTAVGGSFGYGTLFKLSVKGEHKILYSFQARYKNGGHPIHELFADPHGDFYGVTLNSGNRIKGGTAYKVRHTFRKTA